MRILTTLYAIIYSVITASAQTPTDMLANGVQHSNNGNYTCALECYKEAYSHGDMRAANNMAVMYFLGKGVQEDPLIAISLLQEAALKGNAFAMENYGFCLMYGIGTSADEKKASEWFSQAEDAGYWDMCNPYTFEVRTLNQKNSEPLFLQFVVYTMNDIFEKENP